MTDLSAVSIDSVEGPTFRGRVHLINPGARQVPDEAMFPVADHLPFQPGPGRTPVE